MTCQVIVDLKPETRCGKPEDLKRFAEETPVIMCVEHAARWNHDDPHLLVFDSLTSAMKAKDHEPLGEDVSRHCMSGITMHGGPDARGCRFHVRLDSWVYHDGAVWQRCLREHPPVESLTRSGEPA